VYQECEEDGDFETLFVRHARAKCLKQGKRARNLNVRQRMFCLLWASTGFAFSTNGTVSYALAYGKSLEKEYDTCKTSSSDFLKKQSVLDEITRLADEGVLSENYIKKQKAILISQNVDLKVKLHAIYAEENLKLKKEGIRIKIKELEAEKQLREQVGDMPVFGWEGERPSPGTVKVQNGDAVD